MNVGGLFCFFDVDDRVFLVDGDHFADFFVSEIDILAVSYVGSLRIIGITIDGDLATGVDSF